MPLLIMKQQNHISCIHPVRDRDGQNFSAKLFHRFLIRLPITIALLYLVFSTYNHDTETLNAVEH